MRSYPPASAPTTRNGSAPIATALGSGVSGGSCEKSSSQAKNRTNARRERDVVADRPSKHRVARFERVEHGAERRRAGDVDLHVAVHLRQRAEMGRQLDADHDVSVCTSTDSTGGRSRTIAVQLSPLSADAYTWPPVVPKYTPHESIESIAIAPRSTFT